MALLGAQLMLFTSQSHCQHEVGPWKFSEASEGSVTLKPNVEAAFDGFNRSHRSTKESSPPDANIPLWEWDHSMQLITSAWPFSLRSVWLGRRTSSIRMLFSSCENVATIWVS